MTQCDPCVHAAVCRVPGPQTPPLHWAFCSSWRARNAIGGCKWKMILVESCRMHGRYICRMSDACELKSLLNLVYTSSIGLWRGTLRCTMMYHVDLYYKFYRFAFVDDLDAPGIPRVSNATQNAAVQDSVPETFASAVVAEDSSFFGAEARRSTRSGLGSGRCFIKVLHRCPNETCWCNMTHVFFLLELRFQGSKLVAL